MIELPFEIWLVLFFFTFIALIGSVALWQVSFWFFPLTIALFICLYLEMKYNKIMMEKYGHVSGDPYA
jgi:hypothetical protein